MVCSNFLFPSERISFEESAIFKIIGVVDARKSSNSKTLTTFTNNYGTYLTQKIDIFRNPASKMRFTKRVNSLVITANANGQDRSYFISIIIIPKTPHCLIFFGAMHIFKILLMSYRLEISTNQQQLYFRFYFLL